MRRRLLLVLLVVLVAILWRPFLRPLGAGAILVGDIYSSALWDRNLAAYVTPPPRVEDGPERVGAQDMRVTWWIPGWERCIRGHARKAGRLESDATALLDAAFARALARPETKGMTVVAWPPDERPHYERTVAILAEAKESEELERVRAAGAL